MPDPVPENQTRTQRKRSGAITIGQNRGKQQQKEPHGGSRTTGLNYRHTKAGTKNAQTASKELAHGSDGVRVTHIAEALATGKKSNEVFHTILEWITSGGGRGANAELEQRYAQYWAQKGESGRTLRGDIENVFGAGSPSTWKGSDKTAYLLDVLILGEPSSTAQIAMAMGRVTGAGDDEKMMLQIFCDEKNPQVSRFTYQALDLWCNVSVESSLQMRAWMTAGEKGAARDAKKAELEEAKKDPTADTTALKEESKKLSEETAQAQMNYLWRVTAKHIGDFGGLKDRDKALEDIEREADKMPIEVRQAAARPGSTFRTNLKNCGIFSMDKAYADMVIAALGGGRAFPASFFSDQLKDKEGNDLEGEEKQEKLQELSSDVHQLRAYIDKKVTKGHKDPKGLEAALMKLSREQWFALMSTFLDDTLDLARIEQGSDEQRAAMADKGAQAFIAYLEPIADKIKPELYVSYFTRQDASPGMLEKTNGYNTLKGLVKDGKDESKVVSAVAKLGSNEYAWVRNDPELMGKLTSIVKSESGRKQVIVLLGLADDVFDRAERVGEKKANRLKKKRDKANLGFFANRSQKEEDENAAKDAKREFFAKKTAITLGGKSKNAKARGNQKLHQERSAKIQQKAQHQAEHNPEHWAAKIDILLTQRKANSLKFYTLLTQAFYAGRQYRGTQAGKGVSEVEWASRISGALDTKTSDVIEKSVKYKKGWNDFVDGKHVSTDDRIEQGKLGLLKRGKGNNYRKDDVMASFEDLSGFELLQEWSDYEQLRELKQRQNTLHSRLQQFDDPKSSEARSCKKALRSVNARLRVYVPQIRSDRHTFLRQNFNSTTRAEITQGLNDKLADAMENDPAFRLALQFQGVEVDDYAVEDKKVINELSTNQRINDTGAKWRMFSSKSDQMREQRAIMVGRTRNARKTLNVGTTNEQQYQENREKANELTGGITESREDLVAKTARFAKLKGTANAWVLRIIAIATAILAAAISAATLGGATPFAAAMWGALISFLVGTAGAGVTGLVKSQLEGDGYEATQALSDFATSTAINATTALLSIGAAGLQNLAGVLPDATVAAKSLFTAEGAQAFFTKEAINLGKQSVGTLIGVGVKHITSEDRFSANKLGGDIFQGLSTTALSWLLSSGLSYAQGVANQHVDDLIHDPNETFEGDTSTGEGFFNPHNGSDQRHRLDVNNTGDQQEIKSIKFGMLALKGGTVGGQQGGKIGIGLGMEALRKELIDLKQTNPEAAKQKRQQAYPAAKELFKQVQSQEELDRLYALCKDLFGDDKKLMKRIDLRKKQALKQLGQG